MIYWQTLQPGNESEEIDIMLLVDDLPVNAYLDDEFDEWLNGGRDQWRKIAWVAFWLCFSLSAHMFRLNPRSRPRNS